jgi:uncharacterized protein YcfJ
MSPADKITFVRWVTIGREVLMQKRSKRQDFNQMAYSMAQAIAAGNIPATMKTPDGKNPFAVALGRRGGLKGGPARAAKLSSTERSASARKAAKARWADKSE